MKNILKNNPFIDSNKKISFFFDGKKIYGLKGDTIASALLRNKIKLIGRSFKYHRPRGIYTCGIEEPNALVQIVSEYNEPNTRATVKEIYEGMVVESQNRWPSLKFDIGSINNLLSPLFSAGFYYKTFMGPKGFWKNIYEPLIRRTAGLGRPPKEFRSRSVHHNHNVDVVIVGGGLSGLIAAKKIINTNYDVLLIEQDHHLGGILKNSNKIEKIDNENTQDWIKKISNEIRNSNNIKVLKSTQVSSYNYDNYLIAVEDGSSGELPGNHKPELILHKIRTKNTILANGHLERLICFKNNDVPGIMLASSFEKYIHRYGVLPDNKPVIFSNNSSSASLVHSLINLGSKPLAYIDVRKESKIDRKLINALKKNNIPFYPESEIEGCEGGSKIKEIIVKKKGNSTIKIKTSMLCVSGGLNPDVNLFTQSKGLIKWNDKYLTFAPEKTFQNTIVIGSASGNFDFNNLDDEINQKMDFLKANKIKTNLELSVNNDLDIREAWEINSQQKSLWSKSFVDIQNDVTTNDLQQAITEGFDRIEHLKRFTTNSMGTDQGKISSINSLGIVSKILNKKVSEVGTTIYRPPYSPLSFSAIAGRSTYEYYDPTRKTSVHSWHLKNGAVFEDVGQWKRPWYFKKTANETMFDAVQRESKQLRKAAGILDGSTLGKIEIKGKGALEFMNLIYTNAFTKMKPMSARYVLMLGEDGMVKDDGIVCKINNNHFIATTTTGGAAKVLSDMEEYLQTEWPHLEVYLNSITEQFSTFNISGPKSRIILSKVFTNVDFSNSKFPFMTFINTDYEDTKIRILRASFTGELGYEIYVPPKYALNLWLKIFDNGENLGLIPYGTETMHLLRAEKGYIVVGQDTDGTVTPIDLNLKWMIGKNKKDFIGKRSLTRSDTSREDRKQLVGILPLNKTQKIEEGQHILLDDRLPKKITDPVSVIGHVTSSYLSPTLGHYVAMGLIKNGNKLIGSEVPISTKNNEVIKAKIVKPLFLDPENKRLLS